MARPRVPKSPFYRFNSSPEIIRLVVMMYVKYPLSLRNVEDLLAERGIDVCHETVRFWWNRFGPTFASEIRRKRVEGHCQTKCTLTVKGALHIDLEPAAAVARPCFSWTIRTLLPKNGPQRRKILARCIWSDNARWIYPAIVC